MNVVNILDSVLGQRTTRALREQFINEARQLAFVLETRTNTAVAVFDTDMCYVAASQAYVDCFFRDQPDVTPASLVGHCHFGSRDKMPARWQEIHGRVLDGETLKSTSPLFPNAADEIEWVRWDMKPWIADGQHGGRAVIGSIITVESVALDTKSDDTVVESNIEFRKLADSLPGMCWLTDANGKFRWFNERCREYTGLSFQDLLDSTKRETIFGKKVFELLDGAWQHSLKTGETLELMMPMRGIDGLFRPFLLRAVAVRNEFNTISHWIGSAIDVTKLGKTVDDLEHRLNTEIATRQEMQGQLSQAEKITALGQLAGGIAHDFNNILAAIGGSADIILRNLDSPEKIERFAMLIESSVDRGSSVTRRLLSFVHKREVVTEVVDIAKTLKGMQEILIHTLGKAITVQLDVMEGLPTIKLDRGDFETMLVNLATNARDAMLVQGGGTLAISATIQKAGKNSVVPEGNYLCLTVRDNGCGMSPATLSHVMEPFFTTKAAGQGTGLGLPMARNFAERSGGQLTVKSTVGQGTTITMLLPFHMSPVADTVVIELMNDTLPRTLGQAEKWDAFDVINGDY